VVARDGDGLLVGEEVVAAHRGDGVFESATRLAHRVRVLAGVVLDGLRRAAVGVALAQHGVDGAALDLVVAGLDVSFSASVCGFSG
jgi:hypothetical protein